MRISKEQYDACVEETTKPEKVVLVEGKTNQEVLLDLIETVNGIEGYTEKPDDVIKNGFDLQGYEGDIEKLTDYELITVEEEGGEGEGEHYHIVFQLKHKESGKKVYFIITATYQSWDGVYWDNSEFDEVFKSYYVETGFCCY